MFEEIPLRNNFFNFELNTVLNFREWYFNFKWMPRQKYFLIDFGSSKEVLFLKSIPALVNVQLNKNILHILPGNLFLFSNKNQINAPNPSQLGNEVKLIYYHQI